jgi:hypothetical protein
MAIPLFNLEPADYTAVATLGMDDYVLNTVYFNPLNGKWYRYVYNAGADTIVAGDVVGYFSTTPVFGHVSSTAASILIEVITSSGWTCGVGVASIATAKYGFLEVAGPCTNVTTDTNVAAGSAIILDGTTDRAAPVAAGEEHLVFGNSLAADSSTVAALVNLWCPH